MACTEYAFAGLLMYEADVESGLEVVRGVRSRHDGVKRNPWDEVECGHQVCGQGKIAQGVYQFHHARPARAVAC